MRNWKRTLAAATAALAVMAAQAADRPLVGPVPDWVEPAADMLLPATGTDAALLIMLNDQQVRLAPDAVENYFDTRVRIQTPQGLQGMGTIALSWQPDNDVITVHRLNVRRGTEVRDLLGNGDGFTVLRREDMLELATLTGTLTAILQPPDLQVGDIVEFSYTRRHADPVVPDKPDLQFAWLNSPVQTARFRAQWPRNMAVRWQTRDFKPAVRESSSGNSQSIAFTLENPPPLLQPVGAPIRFTALRRLELTTFQSWSEVSKRLAPLYVDAAKLGAGSPLRAEIERIRAASSEPKARAAAALKLVQENVRYVLLAMNDGALKPATADETWQRRYGDCKAKTALLLALLHGLDIDAEPVAVHSVIGSGVDSQLPGITAFDHVLVRARIGGKDYWLDGTRLGDRHLDQLQIPAFGWGLPLTTRGSELVRIEPEPLREPQFVQEIRLDASGGIDEPVPFQGRIVFKGDAAYSTKLAQDNADATQRDQGMRNFWRNRFDDLQLTSVASSFDDTTGALTWTAEGTLRMEWTEYLFELYEMQLGYKADFSRPDGTDTEAPYAVAFPEYNLYRATVKLPDDDHRFSVSGKDINQTIAGREYRRNARIEDGEFKAEASSRSLVAEISATDARAAEASLRKMYSNRLFIQKNRPLPSAAELELEADQPLAIADDYTQRGVDMMDREMYEQASVEFTAALRLEPDNLDALTNRGNLYLILERYDEARADLSRAQELEPNDPYSLGRLGSVALRQGKTAEAIDLLGRTIAIQDNSLWREERADAYLAAGDTRLAAQDLVAISRLDPTTTSHFTSRANDLINKNRMTDARTLATAALDAKAGPGDGAVIASRIHYLTGDDALARDTLREGVRRAPSPEIYLLLAELERSEEDSLAAIQHALKLDPQFAPALRMLTGLQLRMGNSDEAMETAARLGGEGLLIQGVQYAEDGDLDNSRKSFASARSIAEGESQLRALCLAELSSGLLPEALQDCNSALAANPACLPCLGTRGMVLLRMDRNEEALTVFEGFLARQPQDAPSLFGRGLARLKLSMEAEGQADITTALELNPAVERVFDRYGIRR